MPKNEQGEVMCINHPEIKISNYNLVALENVEIVNGGFEAMTKHLPSKLYTCPECGYMELYGVESIELENTREINVTTHIVD